MPESVTLRSDRGLLAEVSSLGAALAGLWLPDRDGHAVDVVLGPGRDELRSEDWTFFGASVGRVAGRIGGACFALDGREYRLSANDGSACLHGGADGFDTRVWQWLKADERCATLRLVSEDGDQGFPGRLVATVEYRFDDAGDLRVEYHATCDRDTVVNLTHHPFWNLAGEDAGGVDDHTLVLSASSFVELDAGLLPTGRLRSVDGGVFDFRDAMRIGDGMRNGGDAQVKLAGGYDHYWVLDDCVDADDGLRLAARLRDPLSGRSLEVWSDQPGIQFYSGNFLDGRVVGKSGERYRAHAGLCLEPQAYPDAANRPGFPSIRLAAGEAYRNRIRYRFGLDAVNTDQENDDSIDAMESTE